MLNAVLCRVVSFQKGFRVKLNKGKEKGVQKRDNKPASKTACFEEGLVKGVPDDARVVGPFAGRGQHLPARTGVREEHVRGVGLVAHAERREVEVAAVRAPGHRKPAPRLRVPKHVLWPQRTQWARSICHCTHGGVCLCFVLLNSQKKKTRSVKFRVELFDVCKREQRDKEDA